LTPEVQAQICEAVAAGNTRHDAAAYAGVGRSTFLAWLARGKQKKGGARYRDFRDAVKKAEADAVVRNVAIIQQAADKTWQAAAWWLERKYPQDWSVVRGELRELLRLARDLKAQHDASPPSPNTAAAPAG
jgi:transposase